MLRTFRIGDLPTFYALMTEEFPDEGRIYGWNAEPFARVIRKFQRPPYRFVLGFLNAIGKPVFRFFVLEVDGEYAASAIESFGTHMAYVSSVVVAPKFRRRGLARRLLAACHDAAAKRREKFVVLDVIDTNASAIALYDSLGYRPVGHDAHFARMSLADVAAPSAPGPVRPFQRNDAPALAAIARTYVPPARQEVHPVAESEFGVPEAVVQALDSQTAAWVVDRGAGPVGWVRASVSPVMRAGHLTAPVLAPAASADDTATLLATALDWTRNAGASRAVSQVIDENTRAAAALRAAGFEVAYGSRTLAWPTGVG
ncbi:MAG: GNAT family N-acetyltransferase [Thermoplasmata archaeon]|nr:GNAT family N-acetyltransferase [Thermoplasmata archaeon]